MSKAQFVIDQAPIAWDQALAAADRPGRSLPTGRERAVRAYVGEAFELLARTGFDPLVHAAVDAARAARAYALFSVGLADESAWDRAYVAWQGRASEEKSEGAFDDDPGRAVFPQ